MIDKELCARAGVERQLTTSATLFHHHSSQMYGVSLPLSARLARLATHSGRESPRDQQVTSL